MRSFDPPPSSAFTPGTEPSHPYAPPLPPGPPASMEHPQAGTLLVLGLVSVFVLPVLGPYTWAKARRALREIDAAPFVTTNRSSVVASLILGIIGTVVSVVCVLLFVVVMTIFALAATAP